MIPILLVDDEPGFTYMFSVMLKPLNVAVATADNGAQAVAMFGQAHQSGKPFAAVILDVMMPAMDGIMTAENIRAYESKRGVVPGVPISFLSARLGQVSEADIERLGIVGVMAKPIGVEELREHVRAVLGV